jgi:uncharacterized membrane protein
VLQAEVSIDVNRPATDVWAYIADLDNLLAWDEGTVSVDWRPPLRLGATFTIVIRVGVLLVGDARVFAYQPAEKVGWESRLRAPRWLGGASAVNALFVTEALGEDRTRLHRRLRLEPHGLLRLATPLFALLLRQDRLVAEEIVNIKAILEGAKPGET